MKAIKQKETYITILFCMFMISALTHTLVHAARTIPGVQRLEEGISAYEHGEYDDAIFKLEMAVYQIPDEDKESLWDAHLYLGLSYLLIGDNEEARNEFSKAQGIIKSRLPDVHIHSPKFVKLFKDALKPRQEGEWKDPTTGMGFVLVKGGCYKMGDTFGDGDDDEKPVHEVCVDDFYIGKYEVKVEEYMKFVEVTGGNKPEWQERGSSYNIDTGSDNYYRKIGSALTSDNHPIVGVSWNNAVAYAKWFSAKTGKNYRLPTEAEWEYAARSGGKSEKFAGTSKESELGSYAWYFNNSKSKTHSVGKKKPNALGIYDMTGNVWEWCQDWYGENYYMSSSKNNPKGPSSGSSRVSRGGSWSNAPRFVRASNRGYFGPDFRSSFLGFRLARTP